MNPTLKSSSSKEDMGRRNCTKSERILVLWQKRTFQFYKQRRVHGQGADPKKKKTTA